MGIKYSYFSWFFDIIFAFRTVSLQIDQSIELKNISYTGAMQLVIKSNFVFQGCFSVSPVGMFLFSSFRSNINYGRDIRFKVYHFTIYIYIYIYIYNFYTERMYMKSERMIIVISTTAKP